MNKKLLFLLLPFLCLTGCFKVSDKIEPKIDYNIQESHLKSLAPAFAPLTAEEKKEDWGRELLIAQGFAKQLDLYRAVFSFKRAEFLLPVEQTSRKLEVQYDVILCYYLGKKYSDIIESFEQSNLSHVDKEFPPFHDLLVILYESYKETNDQEKANSILDLLQHSYGGTTEKIVLSNALLEADIPKIKTLAKTSPPRDYLLEMVSDYEKEKKSVQKAQVLNAFLPGAGYAYIGQKRTALTAFLVNALFIAAAYEFFHRGYTAAGIITSSLETGWYFGGIYGAGEEAKFYNERLYSEKASSVMNRHGLFPVFMIQYSF